MKSYKEMSYSELVSEHNRVANLLLTNHNVFTQKQNRKYLEKIKKELKTYELLRQNHWNGIWSERKDR